MKTNVFASNNIRDPVKILKLYYHEHNSLIRDMSEPDFHRTRIFRHKPYDRPTHKTHSMNIHSCSVFGWQWSIGDNSLCSPRINASLCYYMRKQWLYRWYAPVPFALPAIYYISAKIIQLCIVIAHANHLRVVLNIALMFMGFYIGKHWSVTGHTPILDIYLYGIHQPTHIYIESKSMISWLRSLSALQSRLRKVRM